MKTIYDELSTRDAFGSALLEMAAECDNIYAVSADTEKSMGFSPLAKKYPDRVVNVGICEQNMALVAAGIAACGGKAFAATYAPFASMRILEQVRTFIAYPNLDVKIVSGLAGLSGNVEGVTHQGLEDVSIMRSIPNMTVVVPADYCSTEEITRVITRYNGPVYLRIGRGPVPKVFDESYHFEVGKANVLKEDGADATIFCNGVAVFRVLEAEKLLSEKGFSVRVVEMPCVKPIDAEAIEDAAKKSNVLITVEENNILGGLGGAVAEVVTEHCPMPVLRLGIQDLYTESGPHDELLDKYGFSPAEIALKINTFIVKFQ